VYEADLVCQTVVARTEGLALQTIGNMLGTTRERVRQIVEGALKEFVEGMLDEGVDEEELAELLMLFQKRGDRAEAATVSVLVSPESQ
jgi:hypothetical protein